MPAGCIPADTALISDILKRFKDAKFVAGRGVFAGDHQCVFHRWTEKLWRYLLDDAF
ncbi:hypothetical protein SNSL317_A4545 [Salmonella enterica subsp. enterica serovar Newport str. SL317]|nr:hypothetical protein SNSL317_A4545 [Salmonella enterica subsp. enterica serovar Newport str. SL317]